MKEFKKHIKYLYIPLMILVLFSCKKEEVVTNTIRYEIECHYLSSVLIQWTGHDGGLNGNNIKDSGWMKDTSGTFSHSFETTQDLDIYFSGQYTGSSPEETKIKLFVNDSLMQTATATSGLKAEINFDL
ncbi:MAG: hypothetical protein R3279_03835 [Putridiphycobacter sp.]|nr:hypothetical protein [Putridiphycobacter sp.]